MTESLAKEQLRRMRATAACRFIAAERLRGRDRRNAMLTAVASSIVLSLTVLPLLYHVTPLVNSGLTALSFVTSVLIIAFSLIQYSNNDAANAEQFHRCGLEINEICRHLEFAGATDAAKAAESYNAVLQRYSINHDNADYNLMRLQKKELYNLNWLERAGIRARLFRSIAAPYLLLVLVIVFLVVVLASDRFANTLPFPALPEHKNSN